MITAVGSSVGYRLVRPFAPEVVKGGESVTLSQAALAPVPDTGLTFQTFQMRDYAGIPLGAPRDLTALTPAQVRALPPEERREFFDLLGVQHSLGAVGLVPFDDSRGTVSMGLDEAVLLHLFRQDPSVAGLLLDTNPKLVAQLHADLTGGWRFDEAHDFAHAAFLNLPSALGEEQSQALAALTSQTLQANGHDPQAILDLLAAADAGGTSEFGAGVVLGSVLSGVRDSGEAPLEFLAKLPGRFTPVGLATSLLFKLAAHATDTRAVARANYTSLYDVSRDGLREAGSLEQYDGFVSAGSWNP